LIIAMVWSGFQDFAANLTGEMMLANQVILDMKEASELDELLSLSPEEIRELFNEGDLR
jgi:hypothetical protein